jgi:plasmid stabilization system protein ParE
VPNTPKKYSVTVDPAAFGMLAEHSDFLWQVSPEAADRLEQGFKKSIARIADNPFQFPIADNMDAPDLPPNAYRKCLFERRYKVLFIVEEGDVFVDAVIDSRMENKDI